MTSQILCVFTGWLILHLKYIFFSFHTWGSSVDLILISDMQLELLLLNSGLPYILFKTYTDIALVILLSWFTFDNV